MSDKPQESEIDKKMRLALKHPMVMQYYAPSDPAESAYWQRNMIALAFADGWYWDMDNKWEGWLRVLSLKGGTMSFHIPDSFPVGNLEEILPNWDGHTDAEKWERIYKMREIR